MKERGKAYRRRERNERWLKNTDFEDVTTLSLVEGY
jgi:hypothetical protein